MGPAAWNAIRGTLLLGLLVAFVVSLVGSLLGEHAEALMGAADSGFGKDPGIRVLLLGEDEAKTHPRLTLRPLQDAFLYCPDDKETWHLALEPLHPVELLPQGRDGILVNLPSRDYTQIWHVERLALTTRRMEADGPIPDLATVEAPDATPLFALARDGGRQYRGNLEVVLASATALHAVNALPIEAYLEGVLQSELAASWPDATLEAQAIAGRSFAYAATWERRRERDGLLRYDLTDGGGLDPTYRGTGEGGQKIDWALAGTRGQVLTFFGRPFKAHFHAASGGHTASIDDIDPDATTVDGEVGLSDVMPAQPDPWYQAGLELLDQEERYGARTVTIRTADLRSRLEEFGHEATWVQQIKADRNRAERVATVTLKIIPSSNIVLTGPEFRELVGPDPRGRDIIRSTLWTPESPQPTDDIGTWKITTLGWGHGVGMSQVSAYAMAREGFSHRDILEQYYLGSEIEQKW